MTYIAWCRLPVRPGTLSLALKTFEVIMHYLDDEPGTLDYVANIDDADPDAIWVYERYQDEDASLAHRKSDWLQQEFKPDLLQYWDGSVTARGLTELLGKSLTRPPGGDTEQMIAQFVRLPLQAGTREAAMTTLQDAVDNVQSEQGTLLYRFHADDADPDALLAYEIYTDQAAYDAHIAAESTEAMMPRIGRFLAGAPEMTRLRPLLGKGL